VCTEGMDPAIDGCKNWQDKMLGLNCWFIIEILSFYGYIFGAVVFIFINICKSSFGLLNKDYMKNRYKYDFINYHRQDLDWAAFVQILFNVNIALIVIDKYIVFADYSEEDLNENFPLRWITYQLLANHFLQMIFLRDFYDEQGKVNTKNMWVWYVHLVSYLYIVYVYYLTDAKDKDKSDSAKMWIPLDILLTINITIY